MKHSIEIVVHPEGKIETEVDGIIGPACERITAWLNSLGRLVSHSKKSERKPKKVLRKNTAKTGK